MSKRATVLKLNSNTRVNRRQQLQSRLVLWAELMVDLQDLDARIQTLIREGGLQPGERGDEILANLDNLRDAAIDAVPIE